MSIANVRSALETALNSVTPSLPTAWENVPYVPVITLPYQRACLLTAEPDNQELSSSYTEQGYLQVDLCYLQNTGAGAVEQRAELLRSNFKRGTSFLNGGVTITIMSTPDISKGYIDGDRFIKAVKIRFRAYTPQ